MCWVGKRKRGERGEEDRQDRIIKADITEQKESRGGEREEGMRGKNRGNNNDKDMNRTTLAGKKERKKKEKKSHEICEWIWVVRKNCKKKRGGWRGTIRRDRTCGRGKKKKKMSLHSSVIFLFLIYFLFSPFSFSFLERRRGENKMI